MSGFEKSAFQSLIEEDFTWLLSDNPEYASQAGFYEYDDRLQDLSPEAFNLRKQHNQEMIIRCKSMEFNEAYEKDKMHAELFIKNLSDEISALDMGCHLYPVNSIGYGGVHNNFIESLDWLGEENKLSNFSCRLKAFPTQCEQYMSLLRLGVAEGKVASAAMTRKIEDQLQALISEPPKSLLDLCEKAGEDVVIFKEVIGRLLEFFRNEYLPSVRSGTGAGNLPNGQDVYRQCLRFHTTTGMTAEEVHSIGQSEVARIERRYAEEVLAPLGFTGTLQEFIVKCQDPVQSATQYYSHKQSLLDGYDILYKHIKLLLPKYFETLPKCEMEIVSMDAETAPGAYYMQGTSDGKRPGKFFVNTSNLTKRPIYNMPALALHEAVPGHHLQGSLAIENPSIPPFLRYIEDRRYEFCPARRNLYCAYLEGWALYCEALGEEMGLYKTPMALFGRLSMEMMRAVRLVVDTGIHAKGWTVEEAIQYMMEKTGMHRHEVEAECYRYEAWPGQACAYKVGEVAIWRMRRHAESVLGDSFDIRAFHTCLLDSGPLPLDTLHEKVEKWVASQNR